MRIGARRAFTLIELLTVIAIIAILASILFPAFAKAREKAEQTHCLSNIKQMTTAFNMYATDYDSKLPLVTSVAGYSWPYAIYTYTRNDQILICPANTVEQTFNSNSTPGPVGSSEPNGISYAFNSHLSAARFTRIMYPSQTIQVFDCLTPSGGGAGIGGSVDGDAAICRCNHLGNDPKNGDHGDGMGSIGFCDGHAKVMRAPDLLNTNANSGCRWLRDGSQ